MEVVAAPVAGDDLAEERDLAHAAFGELLALAHDFVHRPRALVAAGFRDDAEGAIHVAALLDRDESRDLFLLEHVIADGVLRTGFLGDVDDGVADGCAGLLRGAQVVEVIGHLVKFLRADNQVDVGQLVEERRAAVLRHAAEDAEDETRVALPLRRDVSGLADGLLLGGIADAAGVEQEHVALGLVCHHAIAAGTQQCRDGLAVALVHLTTIRFDENSVHSREARTTRPPRRVNAGNS